MGVYISIEMSKSCSSCRFVRGCQAINKRIDAKVRTLSRLFPMDRRHSDCPLISVPEPHGRLIDASEKIRVQMYDDMTEDYHIAEMTIDDLLSQGWVEAAAPTIIPASEEG